MGSIEGNPSPWPIRNMATPDGDTSENSGMPKTLTIPLKGEVIVTSENLEPVGKEFDGL